MDCDPASHGVQNKGRGDAACERVQHEFHRIGAFVVAKQDRRFAVGKLPSFGARGVFGLGAIETLDG